MTRPKRGAPVERRTAANAGSTAAASGENEIRGDLVAEYHSFRRSASVMRWSIDANLCVVAFALLDRAVAS